MKLVKPERENMQGKHLRSKRVQDRTKVPEPKDGPIREKGRK